MESEKENLIVSGNLWKQLILFSIPLLASNLLQQLYNAVDSIVVGRYVGGGALAAVGSTTNMIFLVVGFFQGVSTGAGVVISHAIGSGDRKGVTHSIVNALAISFFGGILFGAVAFFMTPYILTWMLTPADIFDMTADYLRIYFISIPLIALYNTGAGAMRALGDSRTPLYFLIASSIVNLILDLYFVRTLNMGVKGVAWATLIAQFCSVALFFFVFTRPKHQYRLSIKNASLDKELMGKVIKIGLPVGIQSSAINLTKVIFQSQINMFGSVAIAGYSAGNRVSSFANMPCNAFGIAATTFTGQNIGAKNYKKVQRIAWTCVALSVIVTTVISLFIYIFRYPLVGIFTDEPDVIYYGIWQLLLVGVPNVIFSVPHILGSVITGTGRSFGVMVTSMVNMCVIRLLWIFVMLRVWYDVRIVFVSFPVSWTTMLICMVVYYYKVMRDFKAEHDLT